MDVPAGLSSETLHQVRERASRLWEVIAGADIDVRPFRPGEDGPLGTFSIPEAEREIERYWVNAPYAYVVITYHETENEHNYYAIEPDLDEFERSLLDRIIQDIRDPLLYRDDVEPISESTLRDELRTLLEQYGLDTDMSTFHKLVYYLHRDFRGYGKVDPLLNDNNIEDISCDGYDLPIFVYHAEYTDIETNISFGPRELDNYVVRLAQQSGKHISVGEPIVETTLPDGSRAELAFGEEVTPRGSAFTIRQYAEVPFTPIDLVNFGTYNIEQMAYFWLCIEHNKSLIFAGGTASGKTTSMNAVSMFIPPRAKVLTIEDTRELSLYHDNWLSSVTRERLKEGADIDMFDLLRSALRHRPEYIIVGEVRGAEAVTLFQAMNTGHTTFSTMHADSIETVINRLENEPINVPRAMVQSLDMVAVQTLVRFDNQRLRRSKSIGEIRGIDQRTGELDYASSFDWNPTSDGFERHDSALLTEIQEERAWSRSEMLSELERRKRFLRNLQDRGITDYRRFTALVNEYYAQPEQTIDRLESITGDGIADSSDEDDTPTTTVDYSSEDGDDSPPGIDDSFEEGYEPPSGFDEPTVDIDETTIESAESTAGTDESTAESVESTAGTDESTTDSVESMAENDESEGEPVESVTERDDSSDEVDVD